MPKALESLCHLAKLRNSCAQLNFLLSRRERISFEKHGVSKGALKLLRLSLMVSKIGKRAYENESITDKTRFRYVAKTISCNISSEETTYAIMKHSSPIIHSGLFSINILVSSYKCS